MKPIECDVLEGQRHAERGEQDSLKNEGDGNPDGAAA
jgi:hypothetical protein